MRLALCLLLWTAVCAALPPSVGPGAAAAAAADDEEPDVTPDVTLTSRIRHGTEVAVEARRDKWTFIAVVGVRQPDGGVRWVCGGSLVSARHVLTAAHCVSGEPADLVVRLGETRLGTTADGAHAERGVLRRVVHPRRAGYLHDLAVVTLTRLVPHAAVIMSTVTVSAGQAVEVAGWGLTEFAGRPSPVLLEAAVTVTDPARCERLHDAGGALFRRLYPGGFGGSMVCAADLSGGGRDACRADSGGPLTVGAPGHQRLVGVINSGTGCGDADRPGIYTDVAHYTDWIVRQILADQP